MDLFVVQLPPFCSYRSLSDPDIFLVLELLLCSFLNARDQDLHPYKSCNEVVNKQVNNFL
jgi:hypothetical protein